MYPKIDEAGQSVDIFLESHFDTLYQTFNEVGVIDDQTLLSLDMVLIVYHVSDLWVLEHEEDIFEADSTVGSMIQGINTYEQGRIRRNAMKDYAEAKPLRFITLPRLFSTIAFMPKHNFDPLQFKLTYGINADVLKCSTIAEHTRPYMEY